MKSFSLNIVGSIIILYFSACIPPNKQVASALQKAWPAHQINYRKSLFYYQAPVMEGDIVLLNNDTLRGQIKLIELMGTYEYTGGNYNYGAGIPFLPEGKNKASDVRYVAVNSINYIKVFKDSTKKDFLIYEAIIFKRLTNLWRLICRKNDISIYDSIDDQLTEGINPYKATVILSTKKEKLYIYDWDNLKNWNYHMNSSITKFINKRYNKSFQKDDFKTTKELLDYIMKKENEKIKLESIQKHSFYSNS